MYSLECLERKIENVFIATIAILAPGISLMGRGRWIATWMISHNDMEVSTQY